MQLGSALTEPPTTVPNYPAGGTLITRALPAPLNASSPVDGTVISWRMIGSSLGQFAPRIVHPAGGDLFSITATGPAQTATASPAISGPFTANLPIQKGDFFGVRMPAGTGVAFRTPVTGGTGNYWNFSTLDEGTPAAAPSNTYNNEEEMMAATVRYCVVPSLKGKSPSAARNALASADCTVGKVKKTKKRKKKKKVLSQSVAPGTSISDTAPVDLKISRKKS